MKRWTCRTVWLFVLFLLFVHPWVGIAEERYRVKSGDSLFKIAKNYGISIGALKEANHLEKEDLRLNEVLLIPVTIENQKKDTTQKTAKKPSGDPDSYVVKKGDNLYSISRRVGLSVEAIKRINQLRSNDLAAGQKLILSTPKNVTEDPEEELEDLEEAPAIISGEGQEEKQGANEPASDKWKGPEERNLFIRVVKNFLGIPYRLGGSTLKGIDCSAFVKKIYEIFNIQLPRTAWEQFRIGKRIKKNELEEGDLVFFKISTRRASNTHVGIYIGNNEFVHASSRNKEVRVDNLDAPYFSKRFVNGIRVKELGEI
ncbi:MAG TPA: LysM peptidoglycan-binding domain-containing protein [Thermodesulfobacteriota bacterium]|nr:LysM peptidoglycan-binding domain-containing protein [Thermodesulfobacteriota bacterium]